MTRTVHMGRRYDGTIDWDRYWAEADEQQRADSAPGGEHAPDVLVEFLDEIGGDSLADVGCGPGRTVFEVAERRPEVTVVGYDAAESVLAENRERARERGVRNVRFEQAALPEFDPSRTFDVVFSYFTLCYVREVERALRSLYDTVAPGGYLVFNYLNPDARECCLTAADSPGEHADNPFVFDPDRFTERFRALLDGDSVLSRERVADALDVEPVDAWTVVEQPDRRWAWHHVPLVCVPK